MKRRIVPLLGRPALTGSLLIPATSVGAIAAGASKVFKIRAQIDPATSATSITNAASVSAQSPSDPVSTNDTSATVTTTLSRQADLEVTKTGPTSAVFVGDNLTYTIKVENLGPSVAANVSVSDTLPAGTTKFSASGTDWTCLGTATITCNRASLGVTTAPDITIVVTVDSYPAGGSLSNTATASSGTTEPTAGNNSNNSDTATTGVSKRLTKLVYTGAQSGQYSDPVGAQATLTDISNGSPGTTISGKMITFTLGSGLDLQTFTATTVSGVATTLTTVPNRINQPAGAKSIASSFAGDAVYASAQADADPSDSDADPTPYTVNKEDAVVSLIEPSVVKIDSTTDVSPKNGNADSINLLLTVDEVNDEYLSGDLPLAPSLLKGLENARPIDVKSFAGVEREPREVVPGKQHDIRVRRSRHGEGLVHDD